MNFLQMPDDNWKLYRHKEEKINLLDRFRWYRVSYESLIVDVFISDGIVTRWKDRY